jgi:hypothetical protein
MSIYDSHLAQYPRPFPRQVIFPKTQPSMEGCRAFANVANHHHPIGVSSITENLIDLPATPNIIRQTRVEPPGMCMIYR